MSTFSARKLFTDEEVNYGHPKGWQLVMLPVLPRKTYSTIGRLTFGLPHRLFPTNRDV